MPTPQDIRKSLGDPAVRQRLLANEDIEVVVTPTDDPNEPRYSLRRIILLDAVYIVAICVPERLPTPFFVSGSVLSEFSADGKGLYEAVLRYLREKCDLGFLPSTKAVVECYKTPAHASVTVRGHLHEGLFIEIK